MCTTLTNNRFQWWMCQHCGCRGEVDQGALCCRDGVQHVALKLEFHCLLVMRATVRQHRARPQPPPESGDIVCWQRSDWISFMRNGAISKKEDMSRLHACGLIISSFLSKMCPVVEPLQQYDELST